MKIIENSNIVNWDDYPEYICALVMQTTKDINMESGLICPKGEEITWLSDKAPIANGEDFELSCASLNCLGGIGFKSNSLNIEFPADLKEIHFKPKPILKIKQNSHKTCEA